MGIDEFRKKFVDEIDESNECGVPATIELGTIYERNPKESSHAFKL